MADSEKNAEGEQPYGVSDITILEGLEAVYKRPGMYIRSTGEHGLRHLVYKVVDNPVNEALAGYAGHIEVAIQEDGGIKVVDNGRDVPVGEHPTEHKPTVEVVMAILRAGGKFGGGDYTVSGGLHGVGIPVVNALSTHVNTEIHRQGYVWHMLLANGGTPITPLKHGEETDETGTAQAFYPDPEILRTVEFNSGTLRQRFQQMAFLNKSLRITLTDERESATDKGGEVAGGEEVLDKKIKGHRTVSYCYGHGLRDYVEYPDSAKKSETINNEITDSRAENDKGTMNVGIAMQWTTAYSSSVHTFASTINTTEGGMYEKGFRTALASLANRCGREKGIIRDKDDNLTGNDVREGLTAVISIKLTEPQFGSQTKTKPGNTETRTFVAQQVYSKLTDWLDAHPTDAEAIINKGQAARTARVAARKAREATRRKGVLESASVPGKLRDCSSRMPSEHEIFIVEDDSTGGSAVGGRGSERQAVLPIHGKIPNVERARLDRALSSDVIRSLITAFGVDIDEDFDISKLRYGKIVIMTDADVDDQHITTLLLTLLFRYMRPPIEGGHTFIAMPPLYRIKWTNAEHESTCSDKERDELLIADSAANYRLPRGGGIQHYKGLSEVNDYKLWETTMDPASRIPKQVTLDEAADADETFTILMGGDVSRRRTFIRHSATGVRFLDIWHHSRPAQPQPRTGRV